ncbi:MAG: MFS transporter [Clostridium sp.]
MRKKSEVYLLIIAFISAIALNMAHPVTPMLIRKLELPTFIFGVFFATMSIGNFIFSPIWGVLSDSKGRVKYLIIGLMGYGISQLGFGYSTNTIVIIIFRFLGGAFVTSYLTVIIAYLTDITTKETRLKIMAYYSAVYTVGAAIGSLLGGLIGNTNYKNSFLIQFFICMFVSLLIYFMFEETVEKKLENIKIKLDFLSFKKYKKTLSTNLLLVMMIVVIFYFAATSYNSTINFYIESVLRLPPSFNGMFLAIAGVLGFLANVILTPYIGKKYDDRKSFKVITLILALTMGLAYLSSNTIAFFIFIILFVTISSVYVPVQQNIVTSLAKDNYGALMGLQNSAKAAGMVMGSLFAGFIFDFGNKLPFMASSIILIVGFIILNITKIEKED